VPEISLNDLLDQTLARAVAITTGNDSAEPRPGQVALAHDILDGMISKTHHSGEAPTGVGKSLAAAAPAAIMAALRQERTIIATESLSLQAQLVDKDLPVVVEAVFDVMGRRPKFALLKGWSNYVCVAAAVQAASELTMQAPTTVAHALETVSAIIASPESEVIKWALEQVVDDESGDKATMPLDSSNEIWDTVSTTPAECPGVAECQFGEMCRPAKARELASEASIVVTNHAMLAMQAAIGVPVVIANKTIGPIHHLVIDEAHGLANTVRSQGATSVSAWRLFDVLRSVEHLHSGSPGKTKMLRTGGLEVMRDLDRHLASKLSRGKTIATIAPNVACLGDGTDDLVLGWLERARALVPRPDSSIVLREVRDRYRAIAKIDALKNAITSMATDATNVARWIEIETRYARQPTGLESLTGAVLRLSPVDVAPLLIANLYDAQVIGEVVDEDATLVMSVTAMSATLPQSAVFDLGVSARREEYESPFSVAFANSALFIPKANADNLAQLCSTDNGKFRFNTSAHAAWAASVINDLVGANEGSALVLSATTAAGKLYAESLRRAHPHLTVLSQWDGSSTQNMVKRWRDDHDAVLIGTRSLMTGTDAPGQTNTLVICDRVARSAGNPVGDARTAKIQERLEIDKWAADRFTYVADASLLLEQAAGRLIRSVSDSGMVAVLDPRLLKSSPVKYPEPTRRIYMEPLEKFGTKISDPAKAREWLVAHRARTVVSEVSAP
jgi:ATP-dependent DNA helicase DinG